VKLTTRVCAAGLLSVALIAALPGGPAFATTEPVTGSGLLAAPTGLTPNDSTVRKTVTLNWSPVSGATSYKVEVGRDATWSDDPVLSSSAFASELTLPVSLPHGSYFWRVAAVKNSTLGHWSSETTDPQFTRGWTATPSPLTPVGAVGARPEFSWTPLPSASAYELQVTDAPFVQPSGIQELAPGHVDTCFTARTRVTYFTEHAENGESNPGACYSTLLGDGSVRYWRVRALDRFTGADARYSTDPAAHGVSDNPPSGIPDPTIASDCQRATDPSGCEPAAASEFGSWSAVTSFTATAVAPSGVYDPTHLIPTHALSSDPDGLCKLNTPSSGVTTCTDFPTLSWDAYAPATRYRVTIALDAAMSNVQRIDDTRGLQWTPTDSWPEGGANASFFYTVQACNDTECGAVTGTPPSFRKVTPRTVITSAAPPVSTEFTQLTWKSYAETLALASVGGSFPATQDAYGYHVQVATSAHSSYDATVDDQLVDETFFVPQKNYGDGSFVWRVQAVDSAGHKLPWSLSQAFVRDATPPRIVSVTPSANVAVKAPLKLVFSEPVTGLSSSTVTLSPSAATTLSVTGGTTATLYPTTGLRPGATYTLVVSPTVKDLAGNSAIASGPSLTVNPFVDDTSTALSYAGGWSVLSSSNAIGGTYHGSTPTSTSHPSATLSFTGTAVTLTVCEGPSNGELDLFVDGVRRARVSTYRSYSGCSVPIAKLGGLTKTVHTFKVVGVGAHVSASKGNGVGLDAISVTP
jgi:hypothetical protein